MLIEQTYGGEPDDRAHFAELLPAFTDRRYFTVDGKPLFYVFRPEQIPDPQAWCERWRQMAVDAGLHGIYLVAEMSDLLGQGPKCQEPTAIGFDAGVYIRLPADNEGRRHLQMRAARKVLGGGPEIYRYVEAPHPWPAEVDASSTFPCVYPNWDNTPRSGRGGLVLTGSHPDRFRRHVEHARTLIASRPDEEQIIFVKSWNEWAEGNYLEPDAEFGHGWLKALQSGVRSSE